jgi:hypothetical protein
LEPPLAIPVKGSHDRRVEVFDSGSIRNVFKSQVQLHFNQENLALLMLECQTEKLSINQEQRYNPSLYNTLAWQPTFLLRLAFKEHI